MIQQKLGLRTVEAAPPDLLSYPDLVSYGICNIAAAWAVDREFVYIEW